MTACAFAASIGVEPSQYCAYEALTLSPIKKKKGASNDDRPDCWRVSATRIADAFRVPPADLWPEAALQIRATKTERRFDAEEASALMAPDGGSPLSLIAGEEERAALRSALDSLSHREREVLSMRFGLDDGIERTHRDIGEAMGVSKTVPCQLEQRALRKVRAHLSQQRGGEHE